MVGAKYAASPLASASSFDADAAGEFRVAGLVMVGHAAQSKLNRTGMERKERQNVKYTGKLSATMPYCLVLLQKYIRTLGIFFGALHRGGDMDMAVVTIT